MTDARKPILAKFVYWFHMACVAFFVFGWLLPKAILLWHVLSVPLVILHWKLNNDQCILTQWQLRLEGKKGSDNNEGEFVKSLFTRFGHTPSRAQLFLVIYGLLLLSGGLSGLRLWLT